MSARRKDFFKLGPLKKLSIISSKTPARIRIFMVHYNMFRDHAANFVSQPMLVTVSTLDLTH